MFNGILLPVIEAPEIWEGERFCRSPSQPLESLLYRWQKDLFYCLIQFLLPVEARRLSLLGPASAANVHFLGQWHIFGALQNSYRPPPLSRARRFAEEWEAAAERARRPVVEDW